MGDSRSTSAREIAVVAERVVNEAIVGGIGRRRGQRAVGLDAPGCVVELVPFSLALRISTVTLRSAVNHLSST
jgi:hypothetical protein